MSDKEELLINPEDEINNRHKMEVKELKTQLLQMRKTFASLDKKKKKAVQTEMANMEINLKEKHKKELIELTNMQKLSETTTELENLSINQINNDLPKDAEKTNKLQKAQQKRERKEEKERIKRELIEKELLNEVIPDDRRKEKAKMKEILKKRGLTMKDIKPDGNCLYASIASQLTPTRSVTWLRQLTANYMQSNPETFRPFITSESGQPFSETEFESYTDNITRTPVWGGQPELLALAKALNKTIEVLQAEGIPVIFGDNNDINIDKNNDIDNDKFKGIAKDNDKDKNSDKGIHKNNDKNNDRDNDKHEIRDKDNDKFKGIDKDKAEIRNNDKTDRIIIAYYRHYYGLGEHYNSVAPYQHNEDSDSEKDFFDLNLD